MRVTSSVLVPMPLPQDGPKLPAKLMVAARNWSVRKPTPQAHQWIERQPAKVGSRYYHGQMRQTQYLAQCCRRAAEEVLAEKLARRRGEETEIDARADEK